MLNSNQIYKVEVKDFEIITLSSNAHSNPNLASKNVYIFYSIQSDLLNVHSSASLDESTGCLSTSFDTCLS